MRALENLKILDFTTLVPGPFATMMLADMGAEVLRIESPTRPDLLRNMPPFADGQSTAHGTLNRNKRSIALDLKNPEAVAIAKRLVEDYDIVIEQFRPGVMQRLGLGYEQLHKINPKLIYCSVTGYGQTGPYRNRAGHDNNYLSISGLNGYSGRGGDRTPIMGMPVADIAGGSLHAVIGILAAVNQRHISGEGQQIDISMTDAMFSLNALFGSTYLSAGVEPTSGSMSLNGGSFYDYYQTSDNRYLSIGSLEPQFFQVLCQTLGDDELLTLANQQDSETQKALRAKLDTIIATKTLAQWREIFKDREACVEPVLTFAEACEYQDSAQREMIVDVKTPNGGSQRQVGSALKLSKSAPEYGVSGGAIGQHSSEILADLGFDKDAIATLRSSGAVA
ncbi:alpha-methylacyl-CoA racemase, putative [marine gamma proteobacterium HTCC2207]|jgi:alpha-methylacyl-CoA racemase|uniref:Alpha-methylacyl-CoA racemase, putative n=1 Tax=gamma proteobacterium HTCC2207 TaxID=314287 RepID=Q1YQ36_9GAMM|nr:alpha-methylacyl-CoA racemase, putative [marine gamma proteobacterium HTCC2207] [gamma proteobacterium HTCC2207]